ncbi:hypothetical protein JCM16303_006526 [Sporobolomyces ruberrimus]
MPPVLPYDVLLQVFHSLDPVEEGQHPSLCGTPPSALALQRSLGSTVSLISRDWRDVGSKYLWSNFILSFATEKFRRKLILLIGNDSIANSVRNLYVNAGIHDVERAVGMPVEFLLPSLPNLQSFELATEPSFAIRIFSQLDLSPSHDLKNLERLVIDTSLSHSAYYHTFLLNLLRRLPLLTVLDISIQLPSTGSPLLVDSIPPASRPLRKLRKFTYNLWDVTTGPSTLSNPFLQSVLSLIDPSGIDTIWISSKPLPLDSLLPFVSSAARLKHLSLTCDRSTMETLLPGLVSILPSFPHLATFELGVLPAWTAPFHVPSASPVPSQLVSALAALDRLRIVVLELDLSFHESVVVEFLKAKWDKGVFERLEWSAWMAVSRDRIWVKHERREEGGWRKEEEGNSIEVVGV